MAYGWEEYSMVKTITMPGGELDARMAVRAGGGRLLLRHSACATKSIM